MRVWALVGSDLHCMHVRVARRFFVNLRNPDPSRARKATRTLPRAHPCLHLYEIAMSEQEYIDNQRQLAAYFAHPDVEGVYETQVCHWLWRSIVTVVSFVAQSPSCRSVSGAVCHF